MMIPSIHLNGTSGNDLYKEVCDALGALRKAKNAICAAAPNARDYYPQGNDAFKVASAEFKSRLDRLDSIITEYETIAEAIADAMEERASR